MQGKPASEFYVIVLNNEVLPEAFTSLSGVKKYLGDNSPGINQLSVLNKAGLYHRRDLIIRKVSLNRIRGRGRF